MIISFIRNDKKWIIGAISVGFLIFIVASVMTWKYVVIGSVIYLILVELWFNWLHQQLKQVNALIDILCANFQDNNKTVEEKIQFADELKSKMTKIQRLIFENKKEYGW